MKKTLNISLAGRLFNIEEDAYDKLDGYLSSVKSHFEGNTDKSEIIKDIEERIAEHFSESKLHIITVETVESLIKTMGTVDQFEDGEKTGETSKTRHKAKQLFRDGDDALVAGVASGLGHYFGIDPIIPRIIFILSIFVGGTGLIIYIILWLVISEAKTASQKLAMHGDPVTLETLSETMRERLTEVKSRDKGGLRRLITLPFRIIGTVLRFVLKIIPVILRVLFGLILTITGVGILVWVMVMSGFLVSGDIMVFDNVPLETFIPGALRFLILLGVVVTALVPGLFAFFGGLSLFRKRNIITSSIALSMLGIWLVALSVSGYGVAKVATRFENMVSTSPAFEEVMKPILLEGDFNKLDIQNGVSVEIVENATTSLSVSGTIKSVDTISAEVINGTLVVNRKGTIRDNFCILCFTNNNSLKVLLSVPSDLESINISGGSSLRGDLESISKLDISIKNGSYIEFTLKVEELIASVSGGSSLSLGGEAESLDVVLENGSHFDGEEFEVTSAKVSASGGSYGEMNVTETLDIEVRNGSYVHYSGNPEVTKKESGGSRVRGEGEF